MRELDYDARVIRAAGVLEGEGSFYTKTGGHTPIISCEMSDFDVVNELLEVFGGTVTMIKPRAEHHKQTWRFTMTGSDAAATMYVIRPYMFSRRRKVIDRVLDTWGLQKAKMDQNKELAMEAARVYKNGTESLRSVASAYGISHETVRRYVELLA